MIRDLASLLAPVPEASFLEHFFAKKRLHLSYKESKRAACLLPWTTINRIIEWDVLPADRFRVIRESVDLPSAMFRRQDSSQRLRAGQLQALLPQGTSLVINKIDALVPKIGRLTDAIERRLGNIVGANAYLSFGRGGAFVAHWDSHDVLVVQIHGSKRWRSYGTPVPSPIEGHHSKEVVSSEIVWENVLEPGDILYLPRGEVHDAALEGENSVHSVHLTIQLRAPRGVDFLAWLTKQATDQELFRLDLSRLGGEANLRQHEMRLKEAIHALIDSTSLAAYLDADDRERPPRTLFSIGDNRLSEDTLVIPAPRRHIALRTDSEDDIAVTIGNERHRLSTQARRVLSFLLNSNGANFGDILAVMGTTAGRETLHQAVLELLKHGLAGLDTHEPSA